MSMQGAEILPGGEQLRCEGRMACETSGPMSHQFDPETVIGFSALYDSMEKCIRGVLWKDSVAHFYHNSLRELLKLSRQLKEGTYKERAHKYFMIYEPKKREIMSIAFRDRVYQRSLNDVVIYPEITKHFIYENMACQKGKGPQKACYKLIGILTKLYNKYGTEAWILQCDVEGYYPNMLHEVATDMFDRYLPPVAARMANEIIAGYPGDVGFNPGSQIIQIVGIGALNDIDHYVKERLRMEYIRYMDDSITGAGTRAELEAAKKEIEKKLEERGMKLHPTKTKIYKATKGIRFLGYDFFLKPDGKVVVHIAPEKVKAEKKKLVRMVGLVRKGEKTKEQVDEHFRSWMEHACFGNSKRFKKRMKEYYNSLWEEENDGRTDQTLHGRDRGTQESGT